MTQLVLKVVSLVAPLLNVTLVKPDIIQTDFVTVSNKISLDCPAGCSSCTSATVCSSACDTGYYYQASDTMCFSKFFLISQSVQKVALLVRQLPIVRIVWLHISTFQLPLYVQPIARAATKKIQLIGSVSLALIPIVSHVQWRQEIARLVIYQVAIIQMALSANFVLYLIL